jgi:hypothetical protein
VVNRATCHQEIDEAHPVAMAKAVEVAGIQIITGAPANIRITTIDDQKTTVNDDRMITVIIPHQHFNNKKVHLSIRFCSSSSLRSSLNNNSNSRFF